MPVITISRQVASYGDEVAVALAGKLGWELITRETTITQFLSQVASEQETQALRESVKTFRTICREGVSFLDYLEQALRAHLKEQSAVLVGFGSSLIFAKDREALKVRIISPESIRIERIKKQYHVNTEEAEQILTQADRKHRRFVHTVFDVDVADYALYDLVLNTASLSVDECVGAISAMYTERMQRVKIEHEVADTLVRNNLKERPELKNASEIEFAKILDLYNIDWIYEPKTFPIEWDAEGNVTMAFSPDFYLTKFDTYLELTTMNQKYVAEKKRKAKRVMELYPGTNVKIVFKRDFASLIERFSG